MESGAFGIKLRELRTQAGMTQAVLAQKSGVLQSTISALEKGNYEASFRTVDALCRALGVSCEAFRTPASSEPQGRGRPRKSSATDAKELARQAGNRWAPTATGKQLTYLRQASKNRDWLKRLGNSSDPFFVLADMALLGLEKSPTKALKEAKTRDDIYKSMCEAIPEEDRGLIYDHGCALSFMDGAIEWRQNAGKAD